MKNNISRIERRRGRLMYKYNLLSRRSVMIDFLASLWETTLGQDDEFNILPKLSRKFMIHWLNKVYPRYSAKLDKKVDVILRKLERYK